jgi:protein tyrosine phosphatase (PTP) superfamily phosphohydrolase (DUF442 family)
MTTSIDAPPPVAPHRRRWPVRLVVLLAAALILAPLGAEAYRVTLGSNFHTVVPGRIYRCSQPTAKSLEHVIAEHGIQTIVNLRGTGERLDWYLAEARTAHQHNVSQEDINFSAGRLPSVSEMQRLILVLERTAYPILLHCRQGADRTGLAAAVALLLTTETPLEDACGQLGLRYGHVALGRPAQLNEFLRFYHEWLKAEGKQHNNETFRCWALDHYRPGSCWSELSFAQAPPEAVAATEPTGLQVRARNASLAPWILRPQTTAGVHLGCRIYDDQDRLVDTVKSGLRDGKVKPGETVDFTLAVPPLRKAGRYRLMIDMVDEQLCWFYQTGSTPLELELIVRD